VTVIINHEEIQTRLTGPCPTLRPSFNQDGSIDYDGVRNTVDFLIDNGLQNIMLTAGDTLFTALSDQEIAQLLKVVVEHTAGRALVVGADRGWGTGPSVEFAKYAREVGADVLMVRPAHWAVTHTQHLCQSLQELRRTYTGDGSYQRFLRSTNDNRNRDAEATVRGGPQCGCG